MSEASTLRGQVNFKVAEREETPWVVIEVERTDFPFLNGGFFGFDLKPGTTYEEAQEIVRLLHRRVKNVTATVFHSAPSSDRPM